MNEIWKDIEGFEGLCQISSFGTVRVLDRTIETKTGKRIYKGRILKQVFTPNGYAFVGPVLNNNRVAIHIHTALAKYFIPNPENKEYVNHINGVKSDNRLENLEWVSARENQAHARMILSKGSKSSKYYGVHFKKGGNRSKRWGALLCVGKKIKSLGYFKTEEEANEAYQNALIEHGIENRYSKAS